MNRITMEVARYRPDQEEEPTFQSYDVPYEREWTVLEYLLINAPKPASKEKLLQVLTGRPYGPMTTQDATPTNLSNALQQILILPAPR